MKRDHVPLFATPLFQVEQPDAEWHNEDWIKKALSLEYRLNGHTNWTSIETDVLDLPNWKLLRDAVQEELDIIIKDYFEQDLNKVKLKITQSWLNINEDQQSHALHTHPNSYMSGVVYLNTVEGDSIRFTDTRFNTRVSLQPMPTIPIPVKKGDMVIFDSQIAHNVDSNARNEKRISLAFNTFPVGEFGNKQGLTYVKIEEHDNRNR